MGNIDSMRSAMQYIYAGMDIEEFINVAGPADEIERLSETTHYFIWDSPVWKGLLRGGYVHRKIVVHVQNSKVVSWSSENLQRSNW